MFQQTTEDYHGSTSKAFKIIDVFSKDGMVGNPVCVIVDATGITTTEMQTVARWTNLSETTFILPPTDRSKADYRVRIFDPKSELPFAGHPTLGSCFAAIDAGIVLKRSGRIVQECKRGLIPVNITTKGLEFGIDNMTSKPFTDMAFLDGCLPGLTIKGAPQIVNAGPEWLVVEVTESDYDLLVMKPDLTRIEDLSHEHRLSGICVFTGEKDIELRTFAPAAGINEDPVCGSGNAAVAYYRNLNEPYVASQGNAIYRNGKIGVRYDDNGTIWISGACRRISEGLMEIPRLFDDEA